MPGVRRAAHDEDSAEVEVLFANMDKLKTLTKKIHGSLGRLEVSGHSVQEAIRPVYGNTSKLQVTNTNINRINDAINNIRKPLDRRKREEPIIRGGLRSAPLSDYLAAMDRTQQAMSDLQNSNLRSNQRAIADLSDLLNHGTVELESAFRDALGAESREVEPLHYITKQLPFPDVTRETSSTLRQINTYMAGTIANSARPWDDTPTAAIYAEVRGPYVAKTLQNLAAASISTIRKTNQEQNYRQGTSGINTYSATLEKLFAKEYDNICPIFAREQWSNVHTATCQAALGDFTGTLQALHAHIKNYMITDCFLAYEIVDIVSQSSFRLEARNPALKQPVSDALRPIRETAKYSLTKLLEDTKMKVNAIHSLPPDAAAVPITQDTMARLQAMTLYLHPLASILASVGDGGWRISGGAVKSPALNNLDVGRDGSDLFASYAGDTIDTLLTSLEAKAKTLLKSKAAQGVFLANNVFIVDRMITMSDLQNLLTDVARQKLDTWRKRGVGMYVDAWREPSVHLRDVQYTNRGSNPAGGRPPSGTHAVDSAAYVKALSSKDKDATKEKFKNFNTSFDELVGRHKTYRMEPDVREYMAKEIASMIEPLYDRFWDRYHEIDKGKGKYVRYDKPTLGAILESLG